LTVLTLPEVGPDDTAVTFDRDGFLASLDPDLRSHSEGRRLLTRLSPLAFAVIYLGPHLMGPDGDITFADCHLDWSRLARDFVPPAVTPKAWRHAFVAARESGKSTFWHLVIPMWAAAHRHAQFIAAFSDAGGQSAIHLGTFKHELDSNPLLQADFPGLCAPSKRPTGASESDSQNLYIASTGFVFAAKGIDAKNLGLKVGRARPDLIILDDVEPDESSYSPHTRDKRLRTITDAILPMNERARVVLVGTVTMPSSITHQTVKAAQGISVAEWIKDEKFVCHHYRPIVTEANGTRRSCWPGKWALSYLEEQAHTRSFKKNFANDPAKTAGTYWAPEDFIYGDLPGVTRTLLSLDPSTTTNTTSDPAGLAVVSWAPPRKVAKEELAAAQTVAERRALKAEATTGRCLVRKAWEARLVGEDLRTCILLTLAEYPEIRMVLVESNQGGEHWYTILHDMPCKVVIFANTVKKHVRAGDLLHHYQMGKVVHEERLTDAESQMEAFPFDAHDDMVDAVGNGVFRFIPPPEPRKARVSSTATAYV
jgi:hypothetical protein